MPAFLAALMVAASAAFLAVPGPPWVAGLTVVDPQFAMMSAGLRPRPAVPVHTWAPYAGGTSARHLEFGYPAAAGPPAGPAAAPVAAPEASSVIVAAARVRNLPLILVSGMGPVSARAG